MKNIKVALLGLLTVIGLAVAPLALSSTTVYAGTPQQELCNGSGGTWSGGNCTNPSAGKTLESYMTDIVNILLFIIGAVSVVMIIIGGVRYTTSNGDQGSVKSAKDTILYAVVGLVVAMMAYAIVNFVISGF